MASTELKRTISSAGSQTKWGASAWVKRCDLGLSAGIYCSSKSDTTQNNRGIFFNADDKIECAFYNSGYTYQVVTNRIFRDTNAWYHVVVNLDTSQSTAADRIKIWVNGVQETSFSTSNYPSQGSTHNFLGTDITQLVGSLREGSSIHHSCIIAHLHFTDGYCYPASSFGETDSTTGEWKIKTDVTGVTYGTNGFWWLKDSIATTDHSPNSNTFTVSDGTLTKTEDCPSNVFATLNPLYKNTTNDFVLANGNTDGTCRDNTKSGTYSTLGMPSGKFYCEVKIRELQGTAAIGVTGRPQGDVHQNKNVGDTTQSAAYRSNGDSEINATTASYGNTWTTNDIIGIAIDVDNSKLYFSKNGTWQNSGDPTSGSTGTGALSMPVAANACEEGAYFFGYGDISTGGSSSPKFSFNFGNGYFATTAVSSAGTNASGIGIFEYDVPAGYTALSTKGLNE